MNMFAKLGYMCLFPQFMSLNSTFRSSSLLRFIACGGTVACQVVFEGNSPAHPHIYSNGPGHFDATLDVLIYILDLYY